MPRVHNYYMFDLSIPQGSDGDFRSGIIDFWMRYTGEHRALAEIVNPAADVWTYENFFFGQDCQNIMAAALRKRDKPMQQYIRQLIRYAHATAIWEDRWDYPSAEEVRSSASTLAAIVAFSASQAHVRLAPQYALLHMRANLRLKRYSENVGFWESTASKLPPSPFRDYCESLYANALLSLDDDPEMEKHAWLARNIYARLGDTESLRLTFRNYRNPSGIAYVYARDPNSPVLSYLVQEFVNGTQETIDSQGNGGEVEDKGLPPTYTEGVNRFLAFSEQVLREGKTHVPCLWQSANAMLRYLQGDYPTAYAEASHAMDLAGTPRMKDVARCIKLLCSTKCNDLTPSYARYLCGEFEWLDSHLSRYATLSNNDNSNYYAYVSDRVTHLNLIPRYRALGRKDMVVALQGLTDFCKANPFTPERENTPGHSTYNEYVSAIDSLTADELVGYLKFLHARSADAFERYVVSHNCRDKAYFSDFIATKYIAEGRFAEALSWLKQVPMLYVNSQGSDYVHNVFDFTLPRWFTHQVAKEPETYDPNWREPLLAQNYRVAFCRDMVQTMSRYRLSGTDVDRRFYAYELAKRYYQASVYGDCWYIARYGKHVGDSARTWEKDLAREALKYLGVCLDCAHGDFKTIERSLYARAYILYNVEGGNRWWWIYSVPIFFRTDEVREAYDALADFCIQNAGLVDSYITRCDVLKQFLTHR